MYRKTSQFLCYLLVVVCNTRALKCFFFSQILGMFRLFSCCKGPISKGENWCSTLCFIQISHQKLSKHDTVCLQHMQKQNQCINLFLFVPLCSQLPVHVSPPSSILQYHPKIPSLQHMWKNHVNLFLQPTPLPYTRSPTLIKSPPLREMITSTLMTPTQTWRFPGDRFRGR